MNWPIDRGQNFKGIYDFTSDQIVCYEQGHGHHVHNFKVIEGLNSDAAKTYLGPGYQDFLDEIELVQGASHSSINKTSTQPPCRQCILELRLATLA